MKPFSRTLTSALEGASSLTRTDTDYAPLRQRYGHPRSREVELPGGVRLHYLDSLDNAPCLDHEPDAAAANARVDRPVLVMVHGLLMDLHAWHAWCDYLGDAFRIITLDLPGHGLTMAPDYWSATIESYARLLNDFVNRLGLEDFTLIGHSMGGNIAWTFALAHPERLDGLGLIASTGWPDTRTQAQRTQSFLNLASGPMGRTLLRKANPEGLVHGVMDDAFSPHEVPAGLIERYTSLACAPGHRDLLLNIAQAWRQRHLATEKRLAALDVPTLIMTGDSDRLVPAEHAYLFADAIKNSELIVYPRTGHIPMLVIPETSAADLRQWLMRSAR